MIENEGRFVCLMVLEALGQGLLDFLPCARCKTECHSKG